MKDVSFVSQKRKHSSLLEEVFNNPSATVDIVGDVSSPWSSSMLGSMPSLLTPWISSHVTAFDDLKLWGHKRLKTAHTPQVRTTTKLVFLAATLETRFLLFKIKFPLLFGTVVDRD